MINKYKETLYLLFLLFSYFSLHAQNSYDSSYTQALSVYKKAAGVNVHLYSGSEYIDYDHRITGNPFFNSLYFTNGSVVFDGILYTDVKMFYDILNDDLIIKNYNDTALILTKEKISTFSYGEHSFVLLVTDSATTGIKTGFYDVLYNGNTKLFVKRKKKVEETISLNDYQSSFIETNSYYIYTKGIFYPVSAKKSALNALKERKTDLIKFMHKNKIKFRRDAESALFKMVAYYDGLNNKK